MLLDFELNVMSAEGTYGSGFPGGAIMTKQ